MNTPTAVRKAIEGSRLDISLYDFRNVKYNNKLYSICYSQGTQQYYAIFSGHIRYPHLTPVLFTWCEYSGYEEVV